MVRCFDVEVNDSRIASDIAVTSASLRLRRSFRIASRRRFAKAFNCRSISFSFISGYYMLIRANKHIDTKPLRKDFQVLKKFGRVMR